LSTKSNQQQGGAVRTDCTEDQLAFQGLGRRAWWRISVQAGWVQTPAGCCSCGRWRRGRGC